MPVCTLCLFSLTCSIPQFLSLLSKNVAFSSSILLKSKVIRWIIKPTKTSVSPLLAQSPPWDLLIIHTGSSELPPELQPFIRAQWVVTSGVPSRLVNSFANTNERLLHPKPNDVPARTRAAEKASTASSSQALELSEELRNWIQSSSAQEVPGAVSMLNLLAFREGLKEQYLKYGAAFAKTVGSRHGGTAKIVGHVLSCSSSLEGKKEWDEIALAHYPSLGHFADMLASKDYQEANKKWRVGSLEDTFILCTSELALERGVEDRETAKL